MGKLYENILDLIGNTPIVKVQGAFGGYKPQNLWAKLEYFNPAGSVKDRVAFNMLKSALDEKKITKDTIIIEPTSGNTGVGLAFCAAVLNMRFIAVMPENMSDERKKLIAAYGADLVLTPKQLGMKGSVERACELAKEYEKQGISVFQAMQFENQKNPEAHYKTTANEIFEATEGKVDIVLAGIGTGGTITGVAKRLKELKPEIKAYGVEAAESPLLTEGKAGGHVIQGISANFVPKTLNLNYVDKVIDIKGEDAIKTMKRAAKSGILVGISSGAVLKAAIEIDKKLFYEGKNKMIVCVLADNGERYLSGSVF